MHVRVYHGEALAAYGFGHGHPFGSDRLSAFWNEAQRRGLDRQVEVCAPTSCTEDDLARFHTRDYIARVRAQSRTGEGYLDYGDTPAFPGVYEAANHVVGSVLDAVAAVLDGKCRRAFVPIAGLHHARRDAAAGFCVFNDLGVAIETLRAKYGVRRVAYVDIDAHHGDGVFYAFEGDADLIFADIHEDGRFLYPWHRCRDRDRQGRGPRHQTQYPVAARSRRHGIFRCLGKGRNVRACRPSEFILLQAGADSLDGDPITHLRYSAAAHAHAAARLCRLADEFCAGRLLATGGGGYHRANLASAWCAVVAAMLE